MLTGLAYVMASRHYPHTLLDDSIPGWAVWTDQSRYLRAARAWAAGDLDAAQHWYAAGYPLLGAVFLRLTGSPFYLVDLGCLLATGVLTVALGMRLGPDSVWTGPGAALAFCLAVPFDRLQLESYVEPWTTTPTTALTLLLLLLALRLWERPTARRATAIGLVAGGIALCRPLDMMPPLVTIGLGSAVMLRRSTPWSLGRLAGAAGAGLAGPMLLGVAAHLAVFGWTRGGYLASSAATGFEWRLLAFHWVTIMVSAAPDLPDAVGLSQAFPVIVVGLVGMVGCLVATSGPRRVQHAMMIGAVWLHILLLLCYRDLHAQGLFQYSNYHYFKWCIPVFALYAWFLMSVIALSERRRWAFGLGLAVAGAAFSWRVDWQLGAAEPALIEAHAMIVGAAPRRVGTGLFVPATGSFESIYLDDQHLRIGDATFDTNQNFKLFPLGAGFVLTPLRALPPGPATLLVNDGVRLMGAPRTAKIRFTLAWPVVWGSARALGP